MWQLLQKVFNDTAAQCSWRFHRLILLLAQAPGAGPPTTLNDTAPTVPRRVQLVVRVHTLRFKKQFKIKTATHFGMSASSWSRSADPRSTAQRRWCHAAYDLWFACSARSVSAISPATASRAASELTSASTGPSASRLHMPYTHAWVCCRQCGGSPSVPRSPPCSSCRASRPFLQSRQLARHV